RFEVLVPIGMRFARRLLIDLGELAARLVTGSGGHGRQFDHTVEGDIGPEVVTVDVQHCTRVAPQVAGLRSIVGDRHARNGTIDDIHDVGRLRAAVTAQRDQHAFVAGGGESEGTFQIHLRMIARYDHDVLCTLGDLVEDVVVWLHEPINYGTDTPARIVRRRGGSAANVAAFAAAVGSSSRFVGQVGTDGTGERLLAGLHAGGVDTVVARGGRTGSIVVVVDPSGERTMLTDRGAATE